MGRKHQMNTAKKSATTIPNVIELLEARRLLSSVALSGGVLKITGDSSSDNLGVWLKGDSTLVAVHNDQTSTYSTGSVDRIEIVGGAGNDEIWLTDEIYKPGILRGGDGNDTLQGGSGQDSLYGGSGDDDLHGGRGEDLLDHDGSGGDSGTTTPTRPSSGTITLNDGELKVTGLSSSANNVTVGLSGSDIVVNHNGTTESVPASSVWRIAVAGGSAADNISISSGVNKPSVMRGNGGNDTISGGSGRDTIYGSGGNDKLSGNDGDDRLRGEDGTDSLYGGNGNDDVNGGAGDDIVQQDGGGTSTDDGGSDGSGSGPSGTITLDDGELKVTGLSSSANNVTVGLSGSYIVINHNGTSRTVASSSVSRIAVAGGSVADNISISSAVNKPTVMRGNGGNDTISGGSGRDTIYGSGGNDKLSGNDGDDLLRGEDGTDSLYGGNGSDDLNGGAGDDIVEQGDSGTTPPDSGGDDGGSIPHDDSATAPNPVISIRDSSIMAGQAVFVHGTNSSLGSGTPQNALYKWDFGDSGSSYNGLHGFNAAHVYTEPGTYTIRLTVTNQAGKVNQTSVTVNVASDTRRRIYVSSSGSDSNSGSQSSPIRTWDKAAAMADDLDNVEVLFRRGDTFNAYTNFDINGNNVLVGAYGSGDRPVINWAASVSGWPSVISPKGTNVAIQDLRFTSSVSNKPQAIRPSGYNITIRNNTFDRVAYAVNANGRPDGLLVQGNSSPSISGIGSYFIWSEGTDHVFLGNTVANSNEEHVIRVVGTDRVLLWGNDLTNTTGDVSGDSTPKGPITLHKGSYYWVARNELNDGPVRIGPLGEGDGLHDTGARLRYAVIDGNVMNTHVFLDHGLERVMFRNNVIKSDGSAILVKGYNSTYGRTTSDVTIVNNTVINHDDGGRFVRVEKGAQAVTLANNLYVAPNLVTGAGESASVYVEDYNLSSFRHINNNVWANANATSWAEDGQNFIGPNSSVQSGYKDASEWNALSGVGTDVFSNVSISSSYAPTSSTTVNNTAESFMGVFHDFNGKVRDVWTAGAIEL